MALTTGSIYMSRTPLQIQGRDGLLLSYLVEAANFTVSTVNGIVVQQGQLLTSVRELADRGGWTEKAVRCSLERLQAGGYITMTVANKMANTRAKKGRKNGTLVKVENYGFLAGLESANGEERAETRAETRATYNQFKTIEKQRNKNDRSTNPYTFPSSVDDVVAFALDHGRNKSDAEAFFRLHRNGYDGKGERITDWRRYFLSWTPPKTSGTLDDQLQRLFGGDGL